MSAQPMAALADELESVVRATPGVVNVYPVGPLVTTVLKSGAYALGLRHEASPIALEQKGDRLRVTVSIGIHTMLGAPETARSATQAIIDSLAGHGIRHPEVHLTVAHIAETTPAPR